MADNVEVSAGATYDVSTDEGTGGHVQRVKLAYSADGSETHVTADGDGLLVNLGSNNDVVVSDGGGSITVDGTVAVTGVATASNQSTIIGHLDGVEGLLTTIDADTGSIASSVATVAGAVAGSEVQVDIVSSAALPVTDNSGSLTVDAPVGTPVFVRLSDGTSAIATLPVSLASMPALATGSNVIGSLTANQSVNQAQVAGTATATNNGTVSAGVQRVTIASDSTGQIIARGPVAADAAVSGNPVLQGGRASTARPTAMSADGDAVNAWLDRYGAQHVVPGACTSATLSNVNDTASSASLLAANTSRKGVVVFNDSTSDLYLKYGTTASLTSFTYKLPAGATWEMPSPIYTGAIDGIWSSNASGAARITELT